MVKDPFCYWHMKATDSEDLRCLADIHAGVVPACSYELKDIKLDSEGLYISKGIDRHHSCCADFELLPDLNKIIRKGLETEK